LLDLHTIANDSELNMMIKSEAGPTEEDTYLEAVITEGKNEWVDILINALQHHLQTKKPFVPHAKIGQADGMRLSRAAFAVMVKFSDLTQELMSSIDEIEMNWDEQEKQVPKILEHLKAINAVDLLLKRWESASKMRLYLQEKKRMFQSRYRSRWRTKLRKKVGGKAKGLSREAEEGGKRAP